MTVNYPNQMTVNHPNQMIDSFGRWDFEEPEEWQTVDLKRSDQIDRNLPWPNWKLEEQGNLD